MSEHHPDLADVAWEMTRAAALLLLDRMRQIEEQVLDPGARWETLRTALRTFERRPRPDRRREP